MRRLDERRALRTLSDVNTSGEITPDDDIKAGDEYGGKADEWCLSLEKAREVRDRAHTKEVGKHKSCRRDMGSSLYNEN